MGNKRFKPKDRKAKGREVRVCKFQRAIMTNATTPGNTMVLAYDKRHDWLGEFQMSNKDADQLFGEQLKFYATAWRDQEGKLHIEKFLPAQDW